MTQPSLTPVPPPPKPGLDIGGQIGATINTFIDPPAVARIVPTKAAWLLPLVIAAFSNIALALITTPITAQIFRNNPPEGMNPEQAQRAAEMMDKFGMVGIITAPLMIVIIMLIIAGLTMAACTVMSVQTRFGQVFTMISYSGLIRAVQVIASCIVLKLKAADIQSTQELQPRFGLDLVITEAPKFVTGILRYFSIFSIWEMIVAVVIFSVTLKISKGKAVGVLVPAWIAGILLTVLATVFQR